MNAEARILPSATFSCCPRWAPMSVLAGEQAIEHDVAPFEESMAGRSPSISSRSALRLVWNAAADGKAPGKECYGPSHSCSWRRSGGFA